MAENKGVVLPFPDAGKRAARGFRAQSALAEKVGDVSRESCLATLSSFAPMGKEIEALLNVPESLYSVGGEDETSFSSVESDTGAARAASSLLRGFPFPSSLPDYGIHISNVGSSVFCTLVDRARKVIVTSEIRNLESEEGSWERFGLALKDAVSAAESYTKAKTPFDFVVNKEGVIRTVKLR
jgi:hypothetical protein